MSGPAALVTGASSGLGMALACELGRRKRSLVLVGRNAERLAATAEAARHAGAPSATPVLRDVRDGAALKAGIAEAAASCGGIDLALHAAGVLRLAPLESTSADDLRECFEANVTGSLHVVQAVLPHLSANHGRLSLVVSITGRLALPGGFGAYAASKWGLRGWAETVRPELAARGISLTLAYPPILATPMVSELKDPPAIYRAFRWHSPEAAARRIVSDTLRGRRESYLTLADRLGALAMGLAPAAFTAALRAHVARAASRSDTA